MNDTKTRSRFIPQLLLTPDQAAREAELDEALTVLAGIAADPEQARAFHELTENDLRIATDASCK